MPIVATLPGYRFDAPSPLPDVDEYGVMVSNTDKNSLFALAASSGVTLVLLSQVGGRPSGSSEGNPYAISDTGWRSIVVEADGAATGSITFRLRRVGNLVEFFLPYNEADALDSGYNYVVPMLGFSLSGGNNPTAAEGLAADDNSPLPSPGTNYIQGFTETSNDGVPSAGSTTLTVYMGAGFGQGRISWLTDDPWPTSLPGTQYTSSSVVEFGTGVPVGIADTGWRTLNQVTDYPGGGGTQTINLRRVGNTVHCQIHTDFVNGGETKQNAGAIPAAFWPSIYAPTADITAFYLPGSPILGSLDIGIGGNVNITAVEDYDIDDIDLPIISWFTDAEWPTTLPGEELTAANIEPVQPITAGETRDTGWRYLGDLYGSDTEYELHTWMRRSGSTVFMQQRSLSLPEDYTGAAYAPPGFALSGPVNVGLIDPPTTLDTVAYGRDATDQFCILLQKLTSGGDVGAWYAASGTPTFPLKLYGHQVTYSTSDPWPTTLPGVSADPS